MVHADVCNVEALTRGCGGRGRERVLGGSTPQTLSLSEGYSLMSSTAISAVACKSLVT